MKKYGKFIVILILISACILYYYSLSSNSKTKSKAKQTNKSKTEVEDLVNRDLFKNYPSTPREVVKLYSRIITSFYDRKYTDDQLESLAKQARALMDQELLDKNAYDEYFENLKADIDQYKHEKKKISSYIIDKSGDIDYKTFDSHYYAKVKCIYYLKGEAGTSRTIETYTLRKDSDGKWKLLYWSLTPADEDEEK